MKRIILLVLILIIIDVVVVSNDSKSLNESFFEEEYINKKEETWERIKTEVFTNGVNKQNPPFKYKGPILFKINHASKKDSLAFNNVLQEIKELLPHYDVDYFKTYTKLGKDRQEAHKGSNVRRLTTKIAANSVNDTIINGYPLRFLKAHTITFNFINSDSSFTRKSMLDVDDTNTFHYFNSISRSTQTYDIAGYLDSKTQFSFSFFVPISYRTQILKNVVVKILSVKNFHISKDYLHNEVDSSGELVLQRYYSPNFESEFKSYILNTYGWRYASYFLNKENYISQVKLGVSIIGIVIFFIIFSFFYNRMFKYQFLNYFFPILAFWVYYIALIWGYDYLTDFSIVRGYKTIYFQLFILPLFALITSFILWRLERGINGYINMSIKLGLHTIYTFIAFLSPVALIYFTKNIYENVFDFFLPLLYVVIGISLGRGLLIYLNHFSDSIIKEKDIELSHLKEMHTKAELKSLQSQINPHFLYNALNSIASLAPVDAKKTQKMAYSLSDLFKYSINRKGKKMTPIKEEIGMVNSYLEIEKIRFGDRLQFVIEVEEGLENNKVPLFLIQPLVENAVKHGISQHEGKGKIVLKIEKEASHIKVSVRDSGPGFPEGLVSGHGLQTVYDLLRLSYGEKASLNWTNNPEKMITITIPETL